ncbi:UDP-glucuronosyltransferase 2B4-like isoform X2 [Cervus elaphus]|uniref:UDP-glucuronosyltransferase 2B4-like isoform X2 n=1 Tax=Cervus elaphus TaxID=9860 RepID=UPI001CC32C30|nr:UDP-glucuronosyltransferase 2B4-like isoform X2 [Cervus elaphus]
MNKMSMKRLSLLLLLQLTCYFSVGSCGKVLVWPVEFSHWLNIKTILDELVTRGHEVTVLISSASTITNSSKPSTMNFETFPVSFTKSDYENFIERLLEKWMNVAKDSFWSYFSTVKSLFWGFFDTAITMCKDAVSNKKLMTKLEESRFDILIADAVGPCGELLAELLKIPFIYSHYTSPGHIIEKNSGRLPFPPSYVPVMLSELSDHMTFMKRIKNMLYTLYFDFFFQTHYEKKWNQFYSEALGRPTTLSETMGKAELWLIRTYWDLSFPRPLLPNVEFVGGLHCKPAKPLPKEMEEFVQSSGENGIVVFSLGSMVSNMSEDRAKVIASALAQIPQKVLWRYDGKKPDTLGPNTRLYKWLPQNDLLGHPKTKAFITHGGSNGVYEAIYHGIPMVGTPLFDDQDDNIARMKAKGTAVSYKENVMRLSAIQHDQPMKPLDRAVFWIEFVMRHKGAKHLRPAIHDLTWFQYHSLDVIGFLLACVATAMFVITKCFLFCCWKFTKRGKKGKRD